MTLAVDTGAAVRPWNRFYEKAVAVNHAHTLLCTAYGRNAQNALRKAHAQAGFQYARFHGIFNDDVGVYTEDAAGGPIYDWSSVDAIYDAVVAAGMRPFSRDQFHAHRAGIGRLAEATPALVRRGVYPTSARRWAPRVTGASGPR